MLKSNSKDSKVIIHNAISPTDVQATHESSLIFSYSACSWNIQKHSFADVLQNRCSQKFHKFLWKTSVLESLINKVAGLKAINVCVYSP